MGVEPGHIDQPRSPQHTFPKPPSCRSLPPRPPFNPHPNLPPARGKGPGVAAGRTQFPLPRAGGGPGWGSNLATQTSLDSPRHTFPKPPSCRSLPRAHRSTPILTFPLPGGRDRKVAAGATRILPPPGRGRAGWGSNLRSATEARLTSVRQCPLTRTPAADCRGEAGGPPGPSPGRQYPRSPPRALLLSSFTEPLLL